MDKEVARDLIRAINKSNDPEVWRKYIHKLNDKDLTELADLLRR